MIGGQMFFSLYVLDALHRLGIHMSVDGAESYFYAWRVVGAMLGIGIEHAPADLDEARRFSDLYMLRNMGPSQEGVRLTRQLVDPAAQLADPRPRHAVRHSRGTQVRLRDRVRQAAHGPVGAAADGRGGVSAVRRVRRLHVLHGPDPAGVARSAGQLWETVRP